MEKQVQDFLNSQNICVAGSFKAPEKPAYRIVGILNSKGYTVYPVNPHTRELPGLPVYPSLKELPGGLEAAVLVTPAAVSLKLIQELQTMGVNKIWLQPGAEDEQVLAYCREKAIPLVWGRCIMMENLPARSEG